MNTNTLTINKNAIQDTIEHFNNYFSTRAQHETNAELKKLWVDAWRPTFESLDKQISSLPATVVVTTGDTSSGKSTLINAVVDSEILTSNSAGTSVTAFATVLQHQDKVYESFVELYDEDEWKDILESFKTDFDLFESSKDDHELVNDFHKLVENLKTIFVV